MSKYGHRADCAMHNEPAYPAGECDCVLRTITAQAAKIARLLAQLDDANANINLKADFIDKTINQLAAQAAEIERLREALGPCVVLLDELAAESGKHVEYGEEDAFRMGEWFEAEDLQAIEAARAALEAGK